MQFSQLIEKALDYCLLHLNHRNETEVVQYLKKLFDKVDMNTVPQQLLEDIDEIRERIQSCEIDFVFERIAFIASEMGIVTPEWE